MRPFEVKPEYNIGHISSDRFISDKTFEDWLVGLGDEVSIIGLFSDISGNDKQSPLVRHGNIAMLPTEKLQTRLGFADVYLIEARSIGGLSGSPVVVQETYHITGSKPDMFGTGGKVHLLGMMQAHWDVNESDINNVRFTNDAQRGVNMGIAIVVPVIKIVETLNDEILAMMRKQIKD